ncbi:hypothetical protein MNV49_004946 [Pseudohyphozyma bogoriensis]|nr:hypothetical protein MNV49_004946 [Pseudohyphozyma bogoriensis]
MLVLAFLLLAILPSLASSTKTWCGKSYLPASPRTPPPPASRFPVPPISGTPLVDFACAQAVTPYLEGEQGVVLVDAAVGLRRGVEFSGKKGEDLAVRVVVGSPGAEAQVEAVVTVAAGAQGVEVELNLSALRPRAQPYTLSCTATSPSGQTYQAPPAQLRYLPPNSGGGTTVRMDGKSGGILVPKEGGGWEPFFPVGFYGKFTGYLDEDLSVVDDLVAKGVNILHPVPTFDNATALELLLDRMEELGIWLMYDMRWVRLRSTFSIERQKLILLVQSYMDADAVEKQVNAVKNRKNLLLWYTSDEPDGPGDPLNATRIAYDLINEVDGYHPISLVLNCEDFEWTSYVGGADIVLTDPYPLYVNTTFSSVYNTECTADFGCCGCDNCVGNMTDVFSRLDSFYDRIEWSGRKRNLTVWSVVQGFGSSEFWWETPSGDEFLAMQTLALIHGLVSWVLPTTPSILTATTQLTSILPLLTSFLLSPHSTFVKPLSLSSTTEIGLWTQNDSSSLLLVANTLNSTTVVTFLLPFAIEAPDVVLESKEGEGGGWSVEGRSVSLGLGGFGVWGAKVRKSGAGDLEWDKAGQVPWVIGDARGHA